MKVSKFKTVSKYFLYTLLVVVLMVACEPQADLKKQTITSGYDEISIIEVDSCEYILYDGYNAGGLTHKGNCKNH